MSIVDVIPEWSRDEASAGGDAEKRTLSWTVLFDAPAADNSERALTAPGIPSDEGGGDGHPYNPRLRVSLKTATAISPILYRVIVHYGAAAGDQTAGGRSKLRYAFGYRTVSEPVDTGVAGGAIVNSAGQPFDPPIEREFADQTLAVTFELTWLRAWRSAWAEYAFATNSDPFFGWEPGQALMLPISGEGPPQGPAAMRFEIWFRQGLPAKDCKGKSPNVAKGGPARAWWARILDQGYVEKVLTDPDNDYSPGANPYVLRNVADENGDPITEPVLLDGSGGKLGDGEDAVFLEFQMHRAAKFGFWSLEIPELLQA